MAEQAPRIVPLPDQQEELLGEVVFPGEWETQITEQFGHAPEFAKSAHRIAEDWRQIMEDEQSICTRLAAVMANGEPPESDAAMDLAEEHCNGLRRWFFDRTPELHVAFAQMFDADEQMRASFERVADGLTGYLRRAIVANADRSEESAEGD